jgi:hypothetical protein
MSAGAIQRRLQSGKERDDADVLRIQECARMARILVWVLIVAVLVGGAIWLSRIDASKPMTRVEKMVPASALPR